MKKLSMAWLLLLLIMPQLNCKAQFTNDKKCHLAAGVALTEACYAPYYAKKWDFGTSTRASFAVVSMASMSKEMYDSYNGGYFSFKDIGYNFIGWGLTVGANYAIHKISHNKKKKKQLIDL